MSEPPKGPGEPKEPTSIEEAKKQLTVEDRLQVIEHMLKVDFPNAIAAYDEKISKREDEKLSKLLDTIIAATTKAQQEKNSVSATPQQGGGMGKMMEEWKPIIDLGTKLLGGGDSAELALGVDFKDIFNEMQRQAILRLKNDYRKALGLPSVVEHVTDAGH